MRPGRWFLACAAAVQVVLGGAYLGGRLARVPAEVAAFTGEAAAPNDAMRLFREVPPLLRTLPTDAELTVVSTLLPFVTFEFAVLPHRMELLQAFPDSLVATTEAVAPEHAHLVRSRREFLARRGALLTDARLAEALADADYLLLAGPPPPAVLAVAERFTELAASTDKTFRLWHRW